MKIRQGFVSNSSSSSFTVVGLRVDKDKIMEETKVRNCRCDISPSPEMSFCPKCGSSTWKMGKTWIEGFADDGIGNFGLEHDYEDPTVLITLGSTYNSVSDYDIEMIKLPDNIYEMKAELKELAEKHDIWDESKFGIWSGVRGDY